MTRPPLRCHTGYVRFDMAMSGGRWDPWRALRERDHIVFALAPLPADIGAVYWPRDGRAALIIDDRLTRPERRAALAHELVHDEHGGGMPASGNDSIDVAVRRHEVHVNLEVADRLVPPAELHALIEQLLDLDEPVRPIDVMEEFDVPIDVAHRALYLMQIRRQP